MAMVLAALLAFVQDLDRKVDVDLPETTLAEALKTLHRITGIEISADSGSFPEPEKIKAGPVFARGVSIASLLSFLFEGRSIVLKKSEGRVIVAGGEKADSVILELYDVRDILELLPEDRRAGFPERVRASVAVWGEGTSMALTANRQLLVTQTRAGHAEISRHLANLRETLGRVVTIEANFLGDVDLSRAGIKKPEGGDRAYQILEPAELDRVLRLAKIEGWRFLSSPRLAVMDGHTATILIGQQVSYLEPGTEGQFRLRKSEEKEGVELKIRPSVRGDDGTLSMGLSATHRVVVDRDALSGAADLRVGRPRFKGASFEAEVLMPQSKGLACVCGDTEGRAILLLLKATVTKEDANFRQALADFDKALELEPRANRSARTFAWTGEADDEWTNPRNWSPEGVPGPNDRAVIKSNLRPPVVRKEAQVGSLEVQKGGKITMEAVLRIREPR
jgi:hypothetical protein